MKKFLACLLLVSVSATTLLAGACGGGNSSDSSSTGSSDSSSQQAELTKADYIEAFTAVQTAMASADLGTVALTSVTTPQAIGYHGLDIYESDLTENTHEGLNQLGILNALAFNYFFVQILQNDNYTLIDEPIVYVAEEVGVATGVLQMVYDGTCLVGQMYMKPNGAPAPGLFSIYIHYDFETNEMVGFEWLLRVAGAPMSMYYYYNGGQGYTLADLSVAETYLDEKMATYTHPTDVTNAVDVVAEWTATNEYANSIAR